MSCFNLYIRKPTVPNVLWNWNECVRSKQSECCDYVPTGTQHVKTFWFSSHLPELLMLYCTLNEVSLATRQDSWPQYQLYTISKRYVINFVLIKSRHALQAQRGRLTATGTADARKTATSRVDTTVNDPTGSHIFQRRFRRPKHTSCPYA
jgi:hypothetical protein